MSKGTVDRLNGGWEHEILWVRHHPLKCLYALNRHSSKDASAPAKKWFSISQNLSQKDIKVNSKRNSNNTALEDFW